MAVPSQPTARGFYVFQAALGAPLQFHPALGTPELDSLMDAYLPSPAPIQDKRASISVDFFDYFRLTGESIKFYQVPDWANSTSSSPNSVQDSGYGSFTASPLDPTWSWPLGTTASTPSTSASTPQISRRSKQPARQPSATDFSNLPGMKILTKDGRDVTNTATRGCKTKEQRDHAHLMRIMKACDACKRKKVRCNPSHRAASVSPEQPARAAKKARTTPQHKPEMAVPSFDAAVFETPTSLPFPDFEMETDFFNETPAEQASWDEFLRFNGELDSVFPDGLGNLPDLGLPSSVSPRLLVAGYPDQNHPDQNNAPVLPQGVDVAAEDWPKLPYMENDEPHRYVDFNLYSPSSSFSDVEPSVLSAAASSISRSEVSRSQDGIPQPMGVGVNEGIKTVHRNRPDGYPDGRTPDHSQSPSSRLQTWPSSSSVPLDQQVTSQDLAAQVPPPPSRSPQGRLSTNVGSSQGMTTVDGLRDGVSREPALRVSRRAHGSQANKASVVCCGNSPALPVDVSPQSFAKTQTPGDAKTRTHQGGSTVFAPAIQAAAANRRPGSDVHHAASGEDERGCGAIEPHRVRATTEPHDIRTTQVKSGVSKRAAMSIMESSGDRQGGSENRLATAAERTTVLGQTSTPAGRTTVLGQASPLMRVSSLKPTARSPVPGDSIVSRSSSRSCVAALGDVPTTQAWASSDRTTTPSWDLLSVVTTLVASMMLGALTFMVMSSASGDMLGGSSKAMWGAMCAMGYGVSRQNQEADDAGSSVKRLRTRHAFGRMDTTLSRMPVLV